MFCSEHSTRWTQLQEKAGVFWFGDSILQVATTEANPSGVADIRQRAIQIRSCKKQ
jgi:hypothetical protein